MKRLRARLVQITPETMKAMEYESDMYLNQIDVPELPSITWESSPLLTEELIGHLRKRGWHPTDIGDALHEARVANGREA